MIKKITVFALAALMALVSCTDKNNPNEGENNQGNNNQENNQGNDNKTDPPAPPADNTLTIGNAIASFVGKEWTGWTASNEENGAGATGDQVFVFKTAEDVAESHPEDGQAYAISSYYPTDYASYDFTGYFTSPEYEIPKSGAAFTFKWAYKYGPEDGVTVQVKSASSDWETITMPFRAPAQHGPVSAGYADLKKYAGEKIQIRLKYYGLVENTGTWYISDFEILPAYVYVAADGAPEGWTIDNAIDPPVDIIDSGVSCGDSDGSSVWFYRASDGWADIAAKTQHTFAAMGYTWDANDADATAYFPEIKIDGSSAIVAVGFFDNYMGEGQTTLVDKNGKVYGAFDHWGVWDDNFQVFDVSAAAGGKVTLGIRYTASSSFPAGTFCITKVIVASK